MIKILFLIFFPVVLFGQLGEANNGNPPSLNWQEISNESVRIIFPEGLDKQAARVADVIDYLSKNNRTSIGGLDGKVDIIFQNQLTESNGFVTAAPFRSEFFTTAPQQGFAGTNDWLDELAIHEYRHVMQLQNSRHGATKWGKRLFGETTWIGMSFLATPFWFAEGDAVMQETLLSKSGRGRSAGFLAQYRAMHEAGVKYSYEKIRNNSFKSFLPNRYKTGYLFSLYGRKKYGNDLWKHVAEDAVKYKGLFWSFSQGLKRQTGMRTPQFYNWMIDSLYQVWDGERTRSAWSPAAIRVNDSIGNHNPTFYGYPKFVSNDELLFLKSSFSDIPRFYSQKDGAKAKKLFTLGYHDYYCNYKNRKLVWTQTTSDVRWPNKTFSVIYIYDFETHEKRQLTHKTKLFSPDINSDGSKIVAVKSDEMMQYQIQILDAESGAVLVQIPNPKNIFFSSPRWKDEQTLVAVAQYHNQNALVLVDVETGRVTPLIDYTANLISNPVVTDRYVLFVADFQEVRNIYAVDIRTKEVFQVTNSRVSANHPDVSEDGRWIVFAERQLNGRDIKKMAFEPKKWKKISITEPIERYTELHELMKIESPILDEIPTQEYVVKKFVRSKDFIKLHSWTPTVVGDDRVGFDLHSTNLLATTDIHIKPSTDFNGYGLQSKLVYNKYFPKLSVSHNMGVGKIRLTDSTDAEGYSWNQAFVGVNIPLVFSKNSYYRSLSFDVVGGFKNYYSDTDRALPKNNQVGLYVNYYNLQQRSRQQLASRFGQFVGLGVTVKQPDAKKNYQVFDAKGVLWLPGIGRTHSLKLTSQYHEIFSQEERTVVMDGPRGYGAYVSKDKGLLSSVEYALPLAYPDWSVGSLLFLKRVRTNVFFDYASDLKNVGFYSTGVELMTDIGVFRFGDVANFPVGIRVSYLSGGKSSALMDHIGVQLVLE